MLDLPKQLPILGKKALRLVKSSKEVGKGVKRHEKTRKDVKAAQRFGVALKEALKMGINDGIRWQECHNDDDITPS